MKKLLPIILFFFTLCSASTSAWAFDDYDEDGSEVSHLWDSGFEITAGVGPAIALADGAVGFDYRFGIGAHLRYLGLYLEQHVSRLWTYTDEAYQEFNDYNDRNPEAMNMYATLFILRAFVPILEDFMITAGFGIGISLKDFSYPDNYGYCGENCEVYGNEGGATFQMKGEIGVSWIWDEFTIGLMVEFMGTDDIYFRLNTDEAKASYDGELEWMVTPTFVTSYRF